MVFEQFGARTYSPTITRGQGLFVISCISLPIHIELVRRLIEWNDARFNDLTPQHFMLSGSSACRVEQWRSCAISGGAWFLNFQSAMMSRWRWTYKSGIALVGGSARPAGALGVWWRGILCPPTMCALFALKDIVCATVFAESGRTVCVPLASSSS